MPSLLVRRETDAMATFDAAFAAWLTFIASLGVDPEPLPPKPAAHAELDALDTPSAIRARGLSRAVPE